MKKIIVTARKENFEKIEPILKDLYHFLNEEGDVVRITIYHPGEGLEDLIDKFHDALDFRYKDSIIEVFTPDFVISPVLKRIRRRLRNRKRRLRLKS